MAAQSAMFDPSIFESLQAKIDEETVIRESLKEIVQTMEKQERVVQSTLSRIHSTPKSELLAFLSTSLGPVINTEVTTLQVLAASASRYPYYKYNHIWTRAIQDCVASVVLQTWLVDYAETGSGRLLTLEGLGQHTSLAVEGKGEDGWRISIEEYLHAVLGVVDDLTRFARNAVTMGDYAAPLAVARFVKDLHAGFQVLNLKNDALRKRGDGLKYRVKEIEDVVYDLTLRGLIKAG